MARPDRRGIPGEPADLDRRQGFSRFTERARNVVMAAQSEARAAGDDQTRAEHLALGLLSEPDGLAARAIAAQGVPLTTVRQAVTALLPPAVDQVPEHILLALLELENGTGVLTGLGIDKAAAGAHVTDALAAILAAHEQKES